MIYHNNQATTQDYKLTRIWLHSSQAEQAKIFGVSAKTWSRWERGENRAPVYIEQYIQRMLWDMENIHSYMETFTSTELYVFRMDNNLTQQTAASITGLTQKIISELETGKKPINKTYQLALQALREPFNL